MNNGMGNIPILVCMTPDHEVYQHSYTHLLLIVTIEGDIFYNVLRNASPYQFFRVLYRFLEAVVRMVSKLYFRYLVDHAV